MTTLIVCALVLAVLLSYALPSDRAPRPTNCPHCNSRMGVWTHMGYDGVWEEWGCPNLCEKRRA